MTIYERKAAYARNKMRENAKVDSLRPEQHQMLEWLCNWRHKLHCNKESLFLTESAFYYSFNNEWRDYEDADFRWGVNDNLASVNLPTISWTVSSPLYIDTDYDVCERMAKLELDDFDSEEEYEKERKCIYNEGLEEHMEYYEDVNTIVEKYLKAVDDKYGTSYCPTGFARLH